MVSYHAFLILEKINSFAILFKSLLNTKMFNDLNYELNIEIIGIEKSKKAAKESDIILAIFDISKPLNKEDREIIKFIKDKKAIIVLNKIMQPFRVDTGLCV